MELTTLFNLDDVFYAVSRTGNVSVWAINNILTSAVGHKVVYELKQAVTGNIVTISEAQLQTKVDEKKMVRNTDDLRSSLTQTFQQRVEDSITKVEKTKREFLKKKLERTLNGNKRKAETSLDSMKRQLGPDVEEIDEIDDEEELAEEKKIEEIEDNFLLKKKEKKDLIDEIYYKWNHLKKNKAYNSGWNKKDDEAEPPF